MSGAPESRAPQSAANGVRGEAALVLGERAFVVRPSFAALVAAEAEVGPLFALVDRAADGALGLSEMLALIWHCVDERPADLTREMLGQMMLDAGLGQMMPVMRQIFGQILQGR